jgi:hypothetical protein
MQTTKRLELLHTYTHTYIHTYIYAYMYTYTDINAYIHTQASILCVNVCGRTELPATGVRVCQTESVCVCRCVGVCVGV